MASQDRPLDIIDLTTEPELEIIVLSDSDIEEVEVPGPSPPTEGAATPPHSALKNDAAHPPPPKRKRKKRKRKSGAGNGATAQNTDVEEGELTSGEASPPETQTVPAANMQHLYASGPNSGSTAASGKRSLAERLSDPSRNHRGEAPQSEGRRKRADDKAREKERMRERAREKDKAREKESWRERDRQQGRDRDRRRSRSPRHNHERGGDRERRRSRSRERERDRDRARRRSRSVEPEREGDHARRRSRSMERERDRRKHDKAPASDRPFFEDVTPAMVPGPVIQANLPGPSNHIPTEGGTNAESPSEPQPADGLLLPAHVSVAQEGENTDMSPLTVPTPDGPDVNEDYIDYLDYDDDRRAPGMVRYWELEKLVAEEARSLKPTRFVCKKCGAEGDHKTYECSVLICLTCGVRDEHPTRSCPISKVCFSCGMKGHINRTCPNRGKATYHASHECDRCGARTHQTNECPTLWRMYEYVEDDVRQEILRVREGKRLLALGEGGEGYIATDEWCYNCGGCGHLGDDCEEAPHPFDKPNEHSAFSLYNILSGPFSSEAPRSAKRAPRDWETASVFADGFGAMVPMEVGKRARNKERDRLSRKARELEEAQDDDDWFGRAHSKARNGAKDKKEKDSKFSGSSRGREGGRIKIKIEQSGSSSRGDRDKDRDRKRQRVGYDDLPDPDTEMNTIHIRGAAARKHNQSSHGWHDRDRDGERDRDRYREREPPRGPRYRGGYFR